MADDRLKAPPVRDFGFYQRRKHDKWREVAAPEPALEATVADSHAHVHMLPDPAWELARCAANGVRFVCEICDPSEDDLELVAAVSRWRDDAAALIAADEEGASRARRFVDASGVPDAFGSSGIPDTPDAHDALELVPAVHVAVGVHPHNARLYDDEIERRLLAYLGQASALGEIGLDYHYDLSPRETQREVFRRQIRLAQSRGLPVALHLRSGEDADADDAHREAFEMLRQEGFPGERTLVHCCALAPGKIDPWIEAGCYIAYGGALTFKSGDSAREGVQLVPEDRLLLETDAPYMTPEPMRGTACTPAHVIFTAARLAEVRGIEPGPMRERFLIQIGENTRRFFAAAG